MRNAPRSIDLKTWWGLGAAAWAVLAPAGATEVISEVHATVVTSIAGASSPDVGKVTYLSAPLVGGVYAGGQISSRTSNQVRDDLATWTDNQFNGPSGRFSFQLTTGAAAGWATEIVTSSGPAKTLDLAASLPPQVAAGDKYRIRKLATVSDIFGGANQGLSLTAGNPSEADNVILFDSTTKSSPLLFRSRVTGFEGWFDATYHAAGDRAISPNQGWIYRRRTNTPASLIWTGVVRDEPVLTTIEPGLNLVGTALVRASPPLSDLGLYSGDPATGLMGGESLALADHVIVVAADGTKAEYFYSTLPGALGWRDRVGAMADAVTFPAGSAFFIDRTSNEPAFDWLLRP